MHLVSSATHLLAQARVRPGGARLGALHAGQLTRACTSSMSGSACAAFEAPRDSPIPAVSASAVSAQS